MKEFTSPITYFQEAGEKNTERTLELARKRADELEISTLLVASTFGNTGRKAVEYLRGKNVIVVTHSQGFKEPNTQELSEKNRRAIITGGAKILTAQHTMGGLNRAIRLKTNTCQPDEIIADVLRIFGAGMKVMMEITMMCADAGLINVGEPIIAIAGSHHGADMAAVLSPENSFNFFNMKIPEIICMPSEYHPVFES